MYLSCPPGRGPRRATSRRKKRKNEGTQILQLHEKLIHVAAVQTCGSCEHVRRTLCFCCAALRLFRAVFTCLRVCEVSLCVCVCRVCVSGFVCVVVSVRGLCVWWFVCGLYVYECVFTCLRVCEVMRSTSCVCAARSQCAPPFLRTGMQSA